MRELKIINPISYLHYSLSSTVGKGMRGGERLGGFAVMYFLLTANILTLLTLMFPESNETNALSIPIFGIIFFLTMPFIYTEKDYYRNKEKFKQMSILSKQLWGIGVVVYIILTIVFVVKAYKLTHGIS